MKNVPCYIKFLSVEPLLERVDLTSYLQSLQWIIVGGESGYEYGKYRYRPCELEWIRDVIQQCKDADVPVFVKQLGTYLAKRLKLRDSKGGNMNEWPKDIRIREFPEAH